MNRFVVAVSGGFDPLHPGHLILIDAATKLGDVVAIVNNDNFLIRKKGKALLPLKDRITILEHIRGVKRVIVAVDEDDTVCRTLEELRPDIFVNSGDRRDESRIPSAETEVCGRIGCKMVFVESSYTNHSSMLLADYIRSVQ